MMILYWFGHRRLYASPYDRRAPFIVSQKHKEPVFDFISPSDVSHTAHELAEQDPNNSLINGIEALTGKNPSLK